MVCNTYPKDRHSSQAEPLRSASWNPALCQPVKLFTAKAGFQIARDRADVWNDGIVE